MTKVVHLYASQRVNRRAKDGEPGKPGISPAAYQVSFKLQNHYVYIYVTKTQGETTTTHLIGKWNDTLTCNVYINGVYTNYKDSDVMRDSYIDLWAFPSAKTIEIVLKRKSDGQQLAIGNYAIVSEFEIQVNPEVVIFDTNDEGKLLTPKQSAEIKCYRNGQDVTNNCGFSLTNNHHLNCTPGPGQKKNMVIIQNITNVTVDGITMPAQNGYAQVQITDEHGGLHYAYVKFQVNITKFVAHVYSNNKTLTSQYSEISGKVNDMSGKLDGLPTGNELKEWKSSIIQTAREISLSVSEKSVGRRNLLVGSAFLREDNHYTLLSDTRVEMNTGYQGTNCIRISDDTTDGETRYPGAFWDGSQGGKSVRITKGKKYVISCWYKTNSANGHLSLEALYTDKQTNAERKGAPKYLSADSLVPKPNQWQLFTTVIDTTDAEYDYIAFNFYEHCSVESGLIEAYICRPMVEEGDTYNGWTLSQNDYDIIGANLIDNSRTLDVGGNVLEAKGQKALVGDAYELTYIGSDDYNTFYRIKGSTFKLNTDYTISFEVRGDAKYMGVYAYYPITNTKFTFYAEPQNGAMTEVTDSGKVDNYVALIQVKELSKQQRVWSHFRFEDRLPEHIYFQFPKNSEQTGVTSWSVTITKPKIEVGAVVTEYTERKSDLIDKASLKKAGIEITSDQVTLYGNKVQVKTPKENPSEGYDEAAMFQNGKLNANLIDAKNVVTQGLRAGDIDAERATIKNLSIIGSSRNPFTRMSEGTNVDYSNNVSVITNINYEFVTSNYELKWDNSQNGRRITLLNYRWHNELADGGATIKAPGGKYFFEDGLKKSALKFSRQYVELLGIGDDTDFYGWVVVNKVDVSAVSGYGHVAKVLAYGSLVATIENNKLKLTLSQKTFDGKKITVEQDAIGYKLRFPSSWGNARNFVPNITPYKFIGNIYIYERGYDYIIIRYSGKSSENRNWEDASFLFSIQTAADFNWLNEEA